MRGARSTLVAATVLGLGCTPTEFGDRHAARVEAYLPTPFLPDDAPFADPEQALGPPDARTVALGEGSHVVLRFFRRIDDGPGADLRVYEVGPDGAQARVAVSRDGQRFIELREIAEGRVTSFDIRDLDLAPIFFVRIRGLGREGPEPGFDLDAVEALH